MMRRSEHGEGSALPERSTTKVRVGPYNQAVLRGPIGPQTHRQAPKGPEISPRAARERKIAAGGRGSGRFAYAQRVPEVVALVRELHGQRQSLRQISKTLAAQGHLTGGGRPYTATAVQKMLRGGG
jgi:hypothetical protein